MPRPVLLAILMAAIALLIASRIEVEPTDFVPQGDTFAAVATAPARPVEPRSHADRLNLYETLFRRQIASHPAKAYHLKLEFEDPDSHFMRRFSGSAAPVCSGSLFDSGNGIELSPVSLTWADDDHVECLGAVTTGIFDGSLWKYRLERINGVWQVVDEELFAVS